MGKAVYEGILIEPRLSVPFAKKVLGGNSNFDDLNMYDPALYKGLMELRKKVRECDRERRVCGIASAQY